MSEALREAKRSLREAQLARRRAVSDADREGAGRAVARLLVSLPQVRRARCVALYAASDDELPTRPVFAALAAAGSRLLFPRVEGRDLEFAAAPGFDALEPGRFGVLAPPASLPAEPLGAEDVVLVPGVAFGRDGHRLGRGGGYYDRLLAGVPVLSLGLAFELQRLPEVPHDSRDRPVDAIVTECGVTWVTGPPPVATTKR